MIRTIAAFALVLAFVAGTAMAQTPDSVSIAETAVKSAAAQMARLDADKNGKITPKEWADGGNLPERFAANDANKDGVVTAAELETLARASLAALDLNKDGEISFDELRASVQAAAGGRGPDGGGTKIN